jgi:hypothetical protein
MNQTAHFTSILQRSIERGVVVSIFSNQYEPEKCSVGYVDTLSTE